LVELQISFIVFAIGVAGLGPLVVMQSRHFEKLESRFNANNIYYLSPSNDEWARKLGACASMTTIDPGPAPSAPDLVIDDLDSNFSVAASSSANGNGNGNGHGNGNGNGNGNNGSSSQGWQVGTSVNSYQGTNQYCEGGDITDVARWEFSGLSAGWYDVRVTWFEDDLQTTAAPFAVYEGTNVKGEFTLNQQVAPTGDIIEGRPWQSLGVFSITTGVLTVELTDANGERVVADGVRLIPVQNDVQINFLEKSISSEEVTAHVTVTVQVPQ
jgi:hypothetical protein